MARAVTLGNDHMLVGLDEQGSVRDLYYPYVGLHNHISGANSAYKHKIGVWIAGKLSWLDDGSWDIKVSTTQNTADGIFTASHTGLEVELVVHDVLYNEQNIFLRKVKVVNKSITTREVKVFFLQQFRIEEDSRSATGMYDPRVNAIIHYKHSNVFLLNASSSGVFFDDYTIGLFNIEGKEGSHHDAVSGQLSKNAIEHGLVDSVIGQTVEVKGDSSVIIDYWLVAGASIDEVHELNQYIIDETPGRVHSSTLSYWNAWAKKSNCSLGGLDPKLQRLFYESLFVVRAHTGGNGSIIASSDSDMLNGGRDTYAYMWPRDASLSAYALDSAGYSYITRKYFRLCNDVLSPDGYFMHKYCPDGSLGSSWHPWVRNGIEQLPIQIDETALTLYSLGRHFEYARDLEFIESIYNSSIERMANFLCEHIDERTGLPKDTYDLWEEKYGSSTYTASAVSAALSCASMFASMLGKTADSERFEKQAKDMRQAIVTYLYDNELGMFVKLLRHTDNLSLDRTIDMSSFHGVVSFNVLPLDDERVVRSFETIESILKVSTDVGGYMRYEGDQYYRLGNDISPNPWVITTLWVARYKIRIAKTLEELKVAEELLWWVYESAYKGSMLPEQVHPYSREPVSATPLTWSHSEYILSVLAYARRVEEGFEVEK